MIASAESTDTDQYNLGQLITFEDKDYVVIGRYNRDNLFVDVVRKRLQDCSNELFETIKWDRNQEGELPVIQVNRVQDVDHLKRISDEIVVRFEGDYTTKRFHRSRFEDHDNRIILEDDQGSIFGVYHISERSLLRAPSEKLSRLNSLEITDNYSPSR